MQRGIAHCQTDDDRPSAEEPVPMPQQDQQPPQDQFTATDPNVALEPSPAKAPTS